MGATTGARCCCPEMSSPAVPAWTQVPRRRLPTACPGLLPSCGAHGAPRPCKTWLAWVPEAKSLCVTYLMSRLQGAPGKPRHND